jgi:hypothetical protein
MIKLCASVHFLAENCQAVQIILFLPDLADMLLP